MRAFRGALCGLTEPPDARRCGVRQGAYASSGAGRRRGIADLFRGGAKDTQSGVGVLGGGPGGL